MKWATKIFSLLIFFICLLSLPLLAFNKTNQQEKGQKKEPAHADQKKETKAVINEEIVVIGQSPKETPLASVTRLQIQEIQISRPTQLSEVLHQVPGASVTLTGKNEFSLRLRGMDSQRLTLLVDGVPLYEPFFATFDLKTLPACGLEAIQVTTGASSCLYGPNVLGGLVNVITLRPKDKIWLRSQASRGELKTSAFSLEGSKRFGKVGAAASLIYNYSDGFYYLEQNNRVKRSLSDYERFNFNLKLIAYPGSKSEMMLSLGIYRSAFSIPPALFLVRPRYWRFRQWDRDFLSFGGLHSLSSEFNLFWRGYSVKFNNSLDQYRDSTLKTLQALSTYRNSLGGLFLLGDYFPQEKFRLRTSLSWRQDIARIQDNFDLPFRKYRHKVSSIGFENELKMTTSWKLVTGLSLDYLQKADGTKHFRLNPLAGAIFSPADHLSFRFSTYLKSRFPTMHSLYATQLGNPELTSEIGRGIEAGIIWDRKINFKLTIFANRFNNLIEAVYLADGSRRFRNVSVAKINGLEMEFRKDFRWLSLILSGQLLDHQNESESRPLDTLPFRQIYFQLRLQPLAYVELNLLALIASHATWYNFSSHQLLTIPNYENVDFILAYKRKVWEFFLKITNLFNEFFYTEPGFPWRARHLEAGLAFNLF